MRLSLCLFGVLTTLSSLSVAAPPSASQIFSNPATAQMVERLATGDTNAALWGRSQGVNMNEKGIYGTRPLHYVVQYSHDLSLGGLRSLINAGAQVNQPDDEGNTPLGLAAARSSGVATQILLGYSAQPQQLSQGRLPLQIAVLSNNRSAFELLALYGPTQGSMYTTGSLSGDLLQKQRYEWIFWLHQRRLVNLKTESPAFWRSLCSSSNDFSQMIVSQLKQQNYNPC